MTQNSVRTPRELVEHLFGGLPSRDADAFLAHFAEDAVFEIPFTVPGMPQRLEGRAAIREHLAERWSGPIQDIQVHGMRQEIYETTDPEVVVVENDVDITPAGGERVQFRGSLNVIRIRDGRVVLFRDYMDTARLAGLRGN
ncbi:nuclear transport factor 2 family protein [Nocardia stercoris]|uniref:SgcJ/EcaC family oxidoreductase n=1 Tax=Nocardia stercoris TaxID=2483361 RepID=A0A3M2KUJ5_9NOCA|nr:SgcJ/EcaC family oxidoreductase [Nocardia stercoris]RMI29332.1 SgcJ/EcaC family oxidoreductase [Nocardia stercoris]